MSVVVGSLAFAVIILMLRTNFLLKSGWFYIPYFWLTVLALFIALAYYNFKHTKSGYRLNPYLLIVISIGISMIAGTLIFVAGWSDKIEKKAFDHFPIYKQMMEKRMRLWASPEQGVIMGKVIQISPDNFMLMRKKDDVWKIYYKGLENKYLREKVQVFGEQSGSREFMAEKVLFWFEAGMKAPLSPDARNMLKPRIIK